MAPLHQIWYTLAVIIIAALVGWGLQELPSLLSKWSKRPPQRKPLCRDQAKVLYWLNLRQSCALLDKRLKERRGEPTLWSD